MSSLDRLVCGYLVLVPTGKTIAPPPALVLALVLALAPPAEAQAIWCSSK